MPWPSSTSSTLAISKAVDLVGELWGEVFELLHDPAYFSRFVVDDTLVWPNGADFAPEFLYERARASLQPERLEED